jgi:hypothetical protein
VGKIEDKEHHEQSNENSIVGTADGLQDIEQTESKKVLEIRFLEKPVQKEKNKRNPSKKQDLQMREVSKSIGKIAEDKAGKNGSQPGAGEVMGQPIHAHSAEDKCKKKKKVVGEDRIFEAKHQECVERAFQDQGIGIIESILVGVVNIRISKAFRGAEQRVLIP